MFFPFPLTTSALVFFGLILLRLTLVCAASGNAFLPGRTPFFVVLCLNLALSVGIAGIAWRNDAPGYEISLFAVAGECCLGSLLGFVLNFCSAVIRFSGELLDTTIGFRLGEMLNPMFEQAGSPMSSFFFMMHLLVFWGFGLYSVFFHLIVYSFVWVPPGNFLRQINRLALHDFMLNPFDLPMSIILPSLAVVVAGWLSMVMLQKIIPMLHASSMTISALLGFSVLVVHANYFLPESHVVWHSFAEHLRHFLRCLVKYG